MHTQFVTRYLTCRYNKRTRSESIFRNRIFRNKESGASLVEFFIVAPVLLTLGLGTMQVGFLYHAKSILNYATFEAARKGAVSHADLEPMEQELTFRLAPIYGGKGDSVSAAKAISSSLLEGVHPLGARIEIINPTEEMFDSWAVRDVFSDDLQIPNHHLRSQNDEIRAGVTLHDANLLKIRSQYGYELKIPLVNRLITSTLSTLDPQNARYYNAGRIPLSSVATVRMQNEVRKSGIELAAARLQTSSGVDSNDLTADGSLPGNIIGNDPFSECDENGLGPVASDFLLPDDDFNSSDICLVSGSPNPIFQNDSNPDDTAQSSPIAPCA